MIKKVFVDASVLIAAILSPDGGSAKIISLAKKGKVAAIISQTVVLEVLDHKEKIGKTEIEITDFIMQNKILVREEININEINEYEGLIDKDDVHLIVGAKLTGCDYLISLDKKHVLFARDKFLPLIICNPKEFLELIP